MSYIRRPTGKYRICILICLLSVSLDHLRIPLNFPIEISQKSSVTSQQTPGLGTHVVGASEVPIFDLAELKERLAGHNVIAVLVGHGGSRSNIQHIPTGNIESI